ncbi:MAG TPA: response regulator [Polyangiaceae bacterium]|nr:response regulator [Polyangiaceae bacterium]
MNDGDPGFGSKLRCGARILVVDDHRLSRDAAKLLLEDVGYAVDCAENAEQALLADAASSDVILLDLQMRPTGGAAVKRELDRRGVSVPVIVVSGADDIARVAQAIGAFAWLHKPLDFEKLTQLIEAALLARPPSSAEPLRRARY